MLGERRLFFQLCHSRPYAQVVESLRLDKLLTQHCPSWVTGTTFLFDLPTSILLRYRDCAIQLSLLAVQLSAF